MGSRPPASASRPVDAADALRRIQLLQGCLMGIKDELDLLGFDRASEFVEIAVRVILEELRARN